MDVFDDWESKRGGRGRNRRLGVQIGAPDGRFRRLGDQNGRKKRLGDRKRLPIVQNVHEAHQMTPNRAKRPSGMIIKRPEGYLGLKKTPDPITVLSPTALTAAALGAHGTHGASETLVSLNLARDGLVLTARINGNLQALQITGAAP